MRSDDAWGAVAGLGASQHGAFTRRQATRHGIGPRDLKRLLALGLLDEPAAGVLVFCAAPRTWRQQLWVATKARGGGLHAGFRASAHLHRFDGFRSTQPLDVVGLRTKGPVRIADVVQHRTVALPDDDLVEVDGISTTGIARTLVDVASVVTADRALQALDDVERRGCSLNWVRLTADRLHRPGQRGTGVVLRLLDQRQQGGRVPDSWFERLVERCVAVPGLPPWSRQHEVRDGAGELVGRIDLACPVLKLGVEAHSRAFHFGSRAERVDQRRDNRFAAEGWDLRYVGWYDTEEPQAVASMLSTVAMRRAELMGVHLPWVG